MITLRKAAIPAFGILALVVAACAGGGGSSPVPNQPKAAAKGSLKITLSVPVAPKGASARTRRAFTVSSATNGLLIRLYVSPYSGTSTAVFTQAYDVSSTSALCTVNADSSRTCTLSIAVGAGTYDVQALSYDQAPASGSIPGTAQQLGYGFLAAQTVSGGATNTLGLTVEGIPNSVNVTVPVSAVRPMYALTQNVGVAVLDAAGSVIMGPFIDALGNTVTVSMSDAHGTGLATFNPLTFSSALATGVAVTYNPQMLTTGQVSIRNTIGVTGTLSNNSATGSATITVPQLVTTYSGVGGGGPAGVTLGSDNQLWFTMPAYAAGGGTGAINSFNTSSGTFGPSPAPVSASSAPLGSAPGPDQIINGPDNKLWMSNSSASALTAFTIAGASYTGYFLPSNATAIAKDTTYVWSVIPSLNQVVRMTVAGGTTAVTIPGPSAQPAGIAYDGTLNMWFTEESTDTIGTVPVALPSPGTITQYSAGVTAGAHPAGIALGADGNMWFTESGGHAIAKITPGGSVTEFAMSNPLYVPGQIVQGPDKALWFTVDDSGEPMIGRFDPVTSTFTVVPIAASAALTSIVTGPDNNLWIGDTLGGNLYRVSP